MAEKLQNDKTEDPEPTEETPQEKALRECRKLNAECTAMSSHLNEYLESDTDFNALNSALNSAYSEYKLFEEEHENVTKKRIRRKAKRKMKRKAKEVDKCNEDLTAYCYYRNVNMLLLESPRAYACMLCQNRQPIIGADGEQICEFQNEEGKIK